MLIGNLLSLVTVTTLGISTPEILRPLEMGQNLAERAGYTEWDASALVRHVYDHSISKDPEFLTYVYAVIYHESHFRTQAISDKGAVGLMQLTSPAVVDAMKQCGLPEPKDLSVPRVNILYGTCYMQRLHSRLDNWTEVLIVYNGGYRALQRYRKKNRLNTETATYVVRVQETVREWR